MGYYSKIKDNCIKTICDKLNSPEHLEVKNWFIKRYSEDLHQWIKNKVFRFSLVNDYYMVIYKHIKKRFAKVQSVIDIGCHIGTQSELFCKEYNYIGIDNRQYCNHFFNINEPNVNYLFGNFPTDIAIDLSDSIVISTGALGQSIDPNMKSDEKRRLLINKLSEAKIFYTNKNSPLLKELKPHFTSLKKLPKGICCFIK